MTRRLFPGFLIFFLTVTSAAAQTIVTATVHDPVGVPYSLASVKAQLVLAGAGVTGQPTVTINNAQQCSSAGQGSAPCQVPFQGTIGPFSMDSNGSFTVVLQDNALVTPAGTQWLFTVTEAPGVFLPFGFGPQSFSVAITISGASQDISTTLNSAAHMLARIPGLQNFSGAPTGACTTGQLGVDVTTGILYTCNGATWTPAAPTSGAGSPTGSCAGNQVYLDTNTGQLYTCNGATWTPASSGGGSAFSYSETGLDALMTSVTNTAGVSLTQNASPVTPGMVLAGPIPPVSGTNTVFDHSTVNSGNSSVISVTGTPSAATGTVLFFSTAAGQTSLIPAPTGFSVFDSSPNGFFSAIYSNTYSSTAKQTVTSSITANLWEGALAFFGGTIGTVAAKQTSSGAFGAGCTTTAAFTPTAGHTQLTFIQFAGGSAQSAVYQVTDSAGDVIIPIVAQQQSSPSVLGQYVFIAQNVVATSRTVSVCFSASVSSAVIKTYDVAGLAPFYSGPAGPWNFRFLSSQDLLGVNGGLGFSKIQAQSSPGCTTQATSYSNCDVTLTWPAPFADANYLPVCSVKDTNMQASGGDGSTGDVPGIAIRSFTASQIVAALRTDAARAITGTNVTVYCVGMHP
jgi:hypothetical protein